MEAPEDINEKVAQLQTIQQQLQLILTQKYQYEIEAKEIESTLKELKSLPEDTPVYRSIGAILVRVKDREELIKELEERKENIEVRLKGIEKQESVLRGRYDVLQREIAKFLRTGKG
ncbi:MAG: prefoldin subunit beta [Thermoplasmata archaeon]|nr:MAG: prefoldin subunit beta [Thermoplasmata archaeon]